MERKIKIPLRGDVTIDVIYDRLLLIHEKFKETDLTIDITREVYSARKNGVKMLEYTLPQIELVFRTEDENGRNILEDVANVLLAGISVSF